MEEAMESTMEEQPELKPKETSHANIAWVEKYRPGALQELISHEGTRLILYFLQSCRQVIF